MTLEVNYFWAQFVAFCWGACLVIYLTQMIIDFIMRLQHIFQFKYRRVEKAK